MRIQTTSLHGCGVLPGMCGSFRSGSSKQKRSRTWLKQRGNTRTSKDALDILGRPTWKNHSVSGCKTKEFCMYMSWLCSIVLHLWSIRLQIQGSTHHLSVRVFFGCASHCLPRHQVFPRCFSRQRLGELCFPNMQELISCAQVSGGHGDSTGGRVWGNGGWWPVERCRDRIMYPVLSKVNNKVECSSFLCTCVQELLGQTIEMTAHNWTKGLQALAWSIALWVVQCFVYFSSFEVHGSKIVNFGKGGNRREKGGNRREKGGFRRPTFLSLLIA